MTAGKHFVIQAHPRRAPLRAGGHTRGVDAGQVMSFGAALILVDHTDGSLSERGRGEEK